MDPKRPVSARDVQRNILIYNVCQCCVTIAYFGLFLWIFFTPQDLPSQVPLGLTLGFIVVMFIIYTATVAQLFEKLKHVPSLAKGREIASIKTQFISFLVGFGLNGVYLTYQILNPTSSFVTEITKCVIVIVTYLLPVLMILVAHYKTFRCMDQQKTQPSNPKHVFKQSSLLLGSSSFVQSSTLGQNPSELDE